MTTLDLLAGLGLVLAAIALRRSAKLAGLMLAAGVLWFLGDVVAPLVFAHRGPLTAALLIYPAAPRVRRSVLRNGTIVIGFVVSAVYPLGRLTVATLAIWILVLLCGWLDPGSHLFPSRSAQLADWCAMLLWTSLAAGALLRTWGGFSDRLILGIYEAAILAICVTLVADHWYRRWQPVSLAELAVDLGERGPRSLREALGDALGDPDIKIGLGSGDQLVDENGYPVSLAASPGRLVTPLSTRGERLGAIEHDAGVRIDPARQDPIVSVIATALRNARLRLEIEDRVAEVVASRHRLIVIADTERQALAGRIDARVAPRLSQAEALIRRVGRSQDLAHRLDDARREVDDFARGLHPALLRDQGLVAALNDLARSADRPTTVTAQVGRLPPPIEAAAYFVVAEALANVAKHAHAETAAVTVHLQGQRLILTVCDDGVGGVNERPDGGIAGMRDRLDAVGGRLAIESSANGTRLRGTIPTQPVLGTGECLEAE